MIQENELSTTNMNATRFQQIINKFNNYSSKISWIVFFFICLFTLGSWLDIAGLWSELPLLCNELPEGWRLPSILTVISQFAQIGPIIFLIGNRVWPKHFTYVRTIYVIFGIGAISCLLLSLFWNKTVKINNESKSVYLYIFNFSLSLLDGISTLTFLPYIGEFFSKEYIIANYLGESLSSLIPGVLAMIQGIESESKNCVNETLFGNSTKIATIKNGPNFSVSVYFILMFVILIISMLAFTALNFTQVAKNARKSHLNEAILSDLDNSLDTISEVVEPIKENRKEIYVLLVITFLGSFINYGYLPGLLSYSTLPYGNRIFHLAINLSSISLPLAILASIWSYKVSVKRISIEFAIAATFSMYICIISILSPCPWLVDSWFGGFLIVISWIIASCIFLRVRCVTAARLEAYGHGVLLNYGLFTIFGQVLGGVLIFFLVNIWQVFKEKPKCASLNYCSLKKI